LHGGHGLVSERKPTTRVGTPRADRPRCCSTQCPYS
jgi:hypothetical protein